MTIQSLIKQIAFKFRKENVSYEQSKRIFSEVRKLNGLKAKDNNKGVKEHLSRDEMQKIIDTAYHKKGQTGLMFKILLFTGCRINEFVNIKTSDVLINDRKILIKEGKGHKQRYVPIFNFYIQELRTYLQYHDGKYLFESRLKNRYTTRRIQQLLKSIAEESGIQKRVHPHMMRRTIATWLRDKNVPIEDIKDFLGHEKIDTTLIYAKSSIKGLQDRAEKLLLEDDSH